METVLIAYNDARRQSCIHFLNPVQTELNNYVSKTTMITLPYIHRILQSIMLYLLWTNMLFAL